MVGRAWVFYSKGAELSQAKPVLTIFVSIDWFLSRLSAPSEIARSLFEKADLDNNKTLEKDEVKKILKRMQINIDNKTLNAKFEAFDKDKNGVFDRKEFDLFIQSLLRKKELTTLFTKHAKDYQGIDDEYVMRVKELVNFYHEEQKMSITEQDALDIINQIKKGSVSAYHDNKKLPKISFYDFGTLIFSNWNLIFNSEHTEVYQVTL